MGFWVKTKIPQILVDYDVILMLHPSSSVKTQHLPLLPKTFTVDWWNWFQTIHRPRFPINI